MSRRARGSAGTRPSFKRRPPRRGDRLKMAPLGRLGFVASSVPKRACFMQTRSLVVVEPAVLGLWTADLSRRLCLGCTFLHLSALVEGLRPGGVSDTDWHGSNALTRIERIDTGKRKR